MRLGNCFLKFAAVLILASSASAASASARQEFPAEGYGQPRSREYREALELYRKGMYARSMSMFRELASSEKDDDAYGYYVLNAVCLRIPGYEDLAEGFEARAQSSGILPQIRFRLALNLFDDEDFEGASRQFSRLSRHNLYRSQIPEFLFKRAYCDFRLRYFDKALLRFKDLAMRAHTDYTAPAQYAIGYIYYEQKSFSDAVEWLEKAAKDDRFEEAASFYLLECRFMLKEYKTVVEDGPVLLEKASEDKKPYIARFISESWLVLGDAGKAGQYFGLSRQSLSPKSRSDFFYAGSVLYALEDYQGAIDNYSMMTDRADSLGQIADYHLGYSFIQTGNKVSAMKAFKDASSTDFDPEIKEDAFFNYAKLAFDLNTDSSVFHDYLELYSDKGKGGKIYSYIALAALYGRDYAGAINAYDKIDELDADMKSNYMKANYLRATQLIQAGAYRAAVDCLRAAAYYSDRRTFFNQMCRYWLAETYYRAGQYQDALKVYTDLYNTSALYGQKESMLIPLNMAYCYMKQDEFSRASDWFSSYIGGGDMTFRKDALLRKGDCLFMEQKYKDAIAAYDAVLAGYFDVDDIYPYYQAAVSYGLSGNQSKKISLLSNVRKASPESAFYPDAMYELGRSLVTSGKPNQAIGCFNTLAASVKDSTFIARAYIELGMIYRNMSSYDKALAYYKKVIEGMPVSEYADAALLAVESIYKSMNSPEKYIAYIESIGRSSLKTDEEKEMMIYNAAEQVFISGNYPQALASLQSYLTKYPDGRMVSDAEYYTGECYRFSSQPEMACDHYLKVMKSGKGSFVEQAAMNYADLSYSMQKYRDAFDAYASLYTATESQSSRFKALTGLMRSAYRAHLHDDAIRYSEELGSWQNADEDLRREAEYVRAKSLLATSRRDEAVAILTGLSSHPDTPEGAEASWFLIQDCYDRGDFSDVENRVYAFSESGTTQTYWLAKAFIVLGDAFVEMDNPEQAKATFESVASGYKPEGEDDDVLQSVEMRLEKLSILMSEENDL